MKSKMILGMEVAVTAMGETLGNVGGEVYIASGEKGKTCSLSGSDLE